jgi:hypothetical protein
MLHANTSRQASPIDAVPAQALSRNAPAKPAAGVAKPAADARNTTVLNAAVRQRLTRPHHRGINLVAQLGARPAVGWTRSRSTIL